MSGQGYDDWPLGAPDDVQRDREVIQELEAIEKRIEDLNVVDLRHANQEKISDESDWKVECPFCDDGLFLVQRNQNPPHQLLEYDNCIGCGQHVRWVDIKEMRQKDGIGGGP